MRKFIEWYYLFLGSNFSNWDSILKDNFSSRTDPSIFTAIAPELLDQSNKTSQVFWGLQSTSNSLSKSTVSWSSDSSSEVKSSCCHKSDAWHT